MASMRNGSGERISGRIPFEDVAIILPGPGGTPGGPGFPLECGVVPQHSTGNKKGPAPSWGPGLGKNRPYLEEDT